MLIDKHSKKTEAWVIITGLEACIDAQYSETIGQALNKLTKIKVGGPKNLSAEIDKYLYKEV